MQFIFESSNLPIIWVVIFAIIIGTQWSRTIPSVGLPLAYLSSFSMLHLLGGLIHLLPWYEPQIEVLNGFTQSTYGAIGFCIGAAFLTPLVLGSMQLTWLRQVPQKPDLRLPLKLFFIGSVFFFVLSPLASKYPGLQALTSSGSAFLVASLCLLCWQAWFYRRWNQFFLWLGISCALPFVTIINSGFISTGTGGTLLILIFISVFYRPRWQTVFVMSLVIFLALSVYVTYMRDRGDIRTSVWGGESLESRYDTISDTFRNFEWIDFKDQDHLKLIDIRINQNSLTGAAIDYIDNGEANFARGETIFSAAINLIPRILWPNKPGFGGSGNIVTRYTGIKFAEGTSVGVTQVLEFYLNFGSLGVFIGFLFLGTIIRLIDIMAAYHLSCGNYWGFFTYFMPGIGILQPGGVLSELFVTSVSALIMVLLVKLTLFSERKKEVLNCMD